ncbi:uncharacterized protein MELLADRAFT_110028 [Melampsora larici-populina 98AG31]|uniref:Uncharacterized protein n=1 Tax=Melampsora larici-populina (strain 98AG31 / pathotype 3-4-7) TaxID=747676 RepID=F4RYF1_MELLP|nr:uncharacterized protein MELLADRAFT_110028 [Melampsora larici-populina 98AG31]EGG02588.1 hypothetical protein MELLADRAFT_110028 [Melampsora larici-populina 98AG31]
MSQQSLREITNHYPPVDVPEAPNLSQFAHCKVLGVVPQDIQGSHSVSKVSDVGVSGEKENVRKNKGSSQLNQTRPHISAQMFEEQLAELNTPSATIGKKAGIELFKQIQEIQQVNASTMIQVKSLMHRATRDIRLLQLRVEDLEVEAMDMQEKLDLANHRIKTHERLIRRFVAPEDVDFQYEYEFESTDEPSH